MRLMGRTLLGAASPALLILASSVDSLVDLAWADPDATADILLLGTIGSGDCDQFRLALNFRGRTGQGPEPPVRL